MDCTVFVCSVVINFSNSLPVIDNTNTNQKYSDLVFNKYF